MREYRSIAYEFTLATLSLVDGDPHDEPIYIRGSHNNLSKDKNRGRSMGLAVTNLPTQVAGDQMGPACCRPVQSTHRQGSGQPFMETAVQMDRRHHERFWKDGNRTHPPKASRLPRRGPHGERMVSEIHDRKMVLSNARMSSRLARKRRTRIGQQAIATHARKRRGRAIRDHILACSGEPIRKSMAQAYPPT